MAGVATVSLLDVGLVAPVLQPGQTAPLYANRYTPVTRHQVVGDVNGDGRLDITICPSFFAYLPLLPCEAWLNDGGTTFRRAGTTEVFVGGATPIGGAGNLWWVDFDGDGRKDLFAVSGGIECRTWDLPDCDRGTHRVFFGQAGGKLLDGSDTALAGDPPAVHHSSGYGDIDGDGRPDIAVCDLGAPPGEAMNFGVYFLMSNADATFTRSVIGLPEEITSRDFDTRLAGVDYLACGVAALVDLDGDGKAELVAGTYINGTTLTGTFESRVYRRDAGGTWILQATIPFPAPVQSIVASNGTRPGASRIVHGDLNGDGRKDLAISFESIEKGDYVQLLRNDGGFAFTDVTLAWLGRHEIGFKQAQDAAYTRAGVESIRDLDGDGIPDLELAWGGFFHNALADKSPLLLNDGTGKLGPWIPTFGGAAFTGQNLADPQWRGLLGIPYTNPTSLLVFDADGDGLQDWVFIDNLDPNPFETPQFINGTYTEARIYIRVVRQLPR